MSFSERMDRIAERLTQAEQGADPMAPVRLALDLAAMALTVPAPDQATRGRQLAKVDRLEQAVATGDTSGLLPGDLDVSDPAAMMAG